MRWFEVELIYLMNALIRLINTKVSCLSLSFIILSFFSFNRFHSWSKMQHITLLPLCVWVRACMHVNSFEALDKRSKIYFRWGNRLQIKPCQKVLHWENNRVDPAHDTQHGKHLHLSQWIEQVHNPQGPQWWLATDFAQKAKTTELSGPSSPSSPFSSPFNKGSTIPLLDVLESQNILKSNTLSQTCILHVV